MSTNVIEQLELRAKADPKKIVFPEADEPKILQAARQVLDRGIAYPTLVGKPEAIRALAESIGVSLDRITIVDHTDPAKLEQVTAEYGKINQMFPASALKRMARDPMYFAAMMEAIGEVDGMVSGITYTTGDVILASQTIIGLQEGISTVSSVGLARIRGYEGPEGDVLAMADCAVNPAPDANQLADIAIASADTSRALAGWEPRVALLSFSTKGSASHERVDTVLEALRIVRERRPDILIDGELQLDSAIVPAVAAKKVKGDSPVAGKANVLIYPDLNAGNIGVKIFGIFAGGGGGTGPILQGFAKPVCDLSRGSDVRGVVGAATVVTILAQGQGK
jgi:phosphate acetyltransferase